MPNCPNLLASGRCDDPQCKHNHNILACDACGYVARTQRDFNHHLQTRKHQRTIEGNANNLVFCRACECTTDLPGWSRHIAGKKHRRKAQRKNLDADLEPDTVFPETTHNFCNICQVFVPRKYWHSHGRTRNHKRKEDYTAYKTALLDAEKDKNGVVVEGHPDFGILEPAVASAGKTESVKISCTIPLAKIVLVSVKLSADIGSHGRSIASQFSIGIEGENRRLSTTRPIILNVTFKAGFIGRYQDRIELEFEDTQLKKRFIITRIAQVIVGDRSIHEQLKARSPYTPRTRTKREPESHVVEGVQAPALNAIPYATRLPRSEIPKHLLSALSLSSQATRENVESIKRGFLPKLLDTETYGRHFKTLIWVEEQKMEEDLERYDMVDSTLGRHLPYYHLEVPGLAEKRPSVLIGDKILVRKNDSAEGHWFAGHVHFVRQYEVGLRFHESFRGWSQSQKYHVRFKLNRIPLRRQHQALDTAFTQARILFPDSSHLSLTIVPRPRLTLFNSLISTNPAQLEAIGSIICAAPGSLPFVIFGPPGTGKTITIVEAIKQLIRKNTNIRILACAPSNSAADLIALRLRETLTTDELFRLYAPSRYKGQVHDDLLPYSFYRENADARGCFSVPPMARMKRFRVVVATCISASIVSGIGLPRGHFSHIFIDEAGQATEPEAFVSIKMMADNDTNVVLSGDPKQLGPIIRSGIAVKLGLELSYIERLMARRPYDLLTGRGKSIIKLVKNFRSHPAILRFPNERFYGGDLESCGEKKVINAYLNSVYLPNKKFPIIFHSVSGKDDREASSPSFFNIDEVILVKKYIQQLKSDRTYRTSDADIGVIAPYHAQCLKIRSTLRGVADEVKVGSVEEFQGQERKVIIISTVRSSKEFVSYDIRHTLGFVASPRRFNVSITRAKALLIVIGDPRVLGLDPLWRSFLNYIYNNGGWKGPSIPWDAQDPVNEDGGYDAVVRDTAALDMNDFTRRMEALTMEGADEELDAGVDRPWRDLE